MAKTEEIQTRKAVGQASIRQNSYNPETRELEVIFATPHPVKRYNDNRDEYFNEVLDVSDAAVELSRFNQGASVVTEHNTDDPNAIIGVTKAAWIEGDKAVVRIQLSDRDELKGFRKDVEDGIRRNVSVGYIIKRYERVAPILDGMLPTYYIREWEPYEISFVTVPADPHAGVRSLKGKQDNKETLYTTQINMEDTELDKTEVRAVVAPIPAAVDVAGVAKQAVAAERKRTNEIKNAVRAAQLEDSFADELIDSGVSADAARAQVIDKMAASEVTIRANHSANITVGKEERDHLNSKWVTGLALRSGVVKESSIDAKLVNESNSYRGRDLVDLARYCLESKGVRTHDLNKEEMVRAAITQSTSDFPVVLGGVIHQIMLPAYAETSGTWQEYCSTGSVSDLRKHRMIRTAGLPNLPRVPENGEYQNIALGDGTFEELRVYKHGAIINMSEEMMINDEFAEFAKAVANLARSYNHTIDDTVAALVNENGGLGPRMQDGKTLYHADHNNLVTPAAAISALNLHALKLKMSNQKDANGRYIGFKPSILLVNDALELKAMQYNNNEYDIDASSNQMLVTNPVRGLFKKIVATPKILPVAGYAAFADPNVAEVIRVSFLNGQRTPDISKQIAFRQDGLEVKIKAYFGVSAVDYRPTAKNQGAA